MRKLTAYSSNKFPIPDISNEPCLLLCPHTTFLSLAFLYDAFAAPNLTPKSFYNLKVLPGQGEQRMPWKDAMEDVYLFRKSVRTAFGVELSDEHLPYNALRTRLLKVGELTGFALPVGAYCFRRGNGEGLDSSGKFPKGKSSLITNNNLVEEKLQRRRAAQRKYGARTKIGEYHTKHTNQCSIRTICHLDYTLINHTRTPLHPPQSRRRPRMEDISLPIGPAFSR